MQRALNDLSDADRRTYRNWTVAFTIVYGSIFIALATAVVMHPPITASEIMKVEAAKAVGAVQVASKRPDHRNADSPAPGSNRLRPIAD